MNEQDLMTLRTNSKHKKALTVSHEGFQKFSYRLTFMPLRLLVSPLQYLLHEHLYV